MNEIITLGRVLKLLDDLPDYPQKTNEIVKSLRNSNFEADPVADYIVKNKVFYNVLCNFNPDITESPDAKNRIVDVISKLDVTSVRNILFTCSLLSLNVNEMTKLLLKKIIMSSYICKDIIEKVNFYRKSVHNPDNFFLYALFHDIGELFTAIYYPERVYKEIHKDAKHINLSYLSNILPHNEVGYMIVKKWKLPSIFSYICLNHNKLEYRKFTSDFIYIINSIAVSDALADELLDYEIPFTNSWDVGHSIYKIGLREDDIYTESGLIGSFEKKINKILSLFNLK
ncbi:MAG: HDOD domain-containing protein [Candidatus Delongbacteria bacterium]|nr:HDOD domain-containing protein [Candidatus Delongbacteria bacterium]MCG2760995.1 HDOD domain-containing protein [Candidatus Delongbacteria bacterium]